MNKVPEISASELVLSAIFFLQQKNGVTASEITKFICDKRKCKVRQVKAQVIKALNRAIKNGIFSRKRGLYRIENGFGEKLNALKEKERRLKKGKNKGKYKSSNNVLLLTNMALKENDFEGGINPTAGKGASPDIGFQYSRFDVFDGKIERPRGDDFSNSSESRTDKLSLKSLKRNFASDNEDYEEDDYSDEDDDDEIDYFAEERNSDVEHNYNAADFKRKSAAKERNRSSDSESPDRGQNKKRKSAIITDKFNKRTRKTSTDESDDEEKKNNSEEDKRNRNIKGGKRGNKPLHKVKRNHKNRQKYEPDFSDNNNTEDSDDEKFTADKLQSDYSNEESDSDNISIDCHQSDQDDNHSFEKNRILQDERQEQEDGKTKEHLETFQEDHARQKKDKHKEDIQLDKQSPLQKSSETDNAKDNPNTNLASQKTNETGKQTLPESHPSSSKTSQVQIDILPVPGSDSRFSQRQTNAKLFRCAQKRIAYKGKSTSERKSTKRRCK